MKRLNLVFIIVSSVLLTQAAYAQQNQTHLSTETTPVYPGITTYIDVPIQEVGYGVFMNNIVVSIEPKDAASTNAVTFLLGNMYLLGNIQDWGDQRTARFKIHVNPDTPEGDYYFNVFLSYTGQLTSTGTPPNRVTTEYKDQILTIKGNPLIVLLNSTLGTVAPVSNTNVTLHFKNTGTGTVQKAVAGINLSGMNSMFSILGGGTQFSLGNLKAGDEASITFNLAVGISATPGVYSIPVTITGENNYISNDVVGLIVAGTTDFETSYQMSQGSLSLNVANVGISPASSVTVSLPNQKNFTIAGTSSSVLGSLNPGDYTSAVFQITKNPGRGNNLDVVIGYTDTSGLRHVITKSLAIQFSAGTQTGTGYRGSGNTLYSTYLPVIAIIILLLVVYWQRKKITTYLHRPEGNK
jgi:hypothetical protein